MFDVNLFHDLVVDDILDPNANNYNPNMKGGRQGADWQGPQRMEAVDPIRNLPKFSGEKTEQAHNHLDAFDDYLEIQQISVVDVNETQSITIFGYSIFGNILYDQHILDTFKPGLPSLLT